MPEDPVSTPLLSELIKRAAREHADKVDSPQVTPARETGIGLGPHLAFLLPAAADVGSTIWAMQHGMQEGNPLLRWAPPNARLPIGIGMETAGYLLGRKLLKDKPTLMKILLAGAGAGHGAAAAYNLFSSNQR